MMFDKRFHKYDLSYMKGIDSNDLFMGEKRVLEKLIYHIKLIPNIHISLYFEEFG